jgi:hypothetical protein
VDSSAHARRWGSAVILLIALAALSSLAAAGAPGGRDGQRSGPGKKMWPRVAYPRRAAARRAELFAAGRGDVSFAVIDPSVGLLGYDPDRQFSSASATKALLLAAELRRLRDEHERLNQGTRDLLEPMITYSDNRAADAIYARVGDAGLEEVAERAGMRDFEVTPGFWGGDRITAADMARFFYRLEGNLVGPYGDYGKRLLGRITSVESWGIPEAVGGGWSMWFKGGWRPAGQEHTSGPVTHQAALLEHRGGERLALAVLTDEPPGEGGGFSAIEGVTSRLLASPPPHRGGWAVP